jgi:hypothetical protein
MTLLYIFAATLVPPVAVFLISASILVTIAIKRVYLEVQKNKKTRVLRVKY